MKLEKDRKIYRKQRSHKNPNEQQNQKQAIDAEADAYKLGGKNQKYSGSSNSKSWNFGGTVLGKGRYQNLR